MKEPGQVETIGNGMVNVHNQGHQDVLTLCCIFAAGHNGRKELALVKNRNVEVFAAQEADANRRPGSCNPGHTFKSISTYFIVILPMLCYHYAVFSLCT